ncbi:MAG TPA: hypothetical protein VHN18_13690, partial [Micromonosporaceae bacterium]|nr:hypothetical protein [Micromonosporaceae bacterium]
MSDGPVPASDTADRDPRTSTSTVEQGDVEPARSTPPVAGLATPHEVAAGPGVDDEERPARQLTGPIGAGVAVVAFAVALLVLWNVFRPLPQGSQFY